MFLVFFILSETLVLHWYYAQEANKLAIEANDIAREANDIAREAAENVTRIARDALVISSKQADIIGVIASTLALMTGVFVIFFALMEARHNDTDMKKPVVASQTDPKST